MSFTRFQTDISEIELPEKFTFPFNYTPHPLAVIAANELQKHIEEKLTSHHEFGLNESESGIGKMFGVLVVKNRENELGYISAFSGKLGFKNDYDAFVPPVYDMLALDGFYSKEEELIYVENRKIEAIIQSNEYKNLIETRAEYLSMSVEEINAIKLRNKEAKSIRNQIKSSKELSEIELKELDRQSSNQSYDLKNLTNEWKDKIKEIEHKISEFSTVIDTIKAKRKQMSYDLQQRLFSEYSFLNARKEWKSLREIFSISENIFPPSGAGECAAPKLLQAAFQHGYKPICLAEFWYGRSPSSEIRQHKQFYPSCKTKCYPILSHMLLGLDVEVNPLADNPNPSVRLETIWEDEYIAVIHKPEGFLSVNGKEISDSVQSRMRSTYPKAKGPMIVHRLDMSTSGIMLIAKTKDIHYHLQRQFENRSIKKRYVAILDGIVLTDSGEISLPIRVDFDHRPRQLVCHEYGKPSQTHYEVIERNDGKTRIYFYPMTGRTHQLRIHSAHKDGLGMPILGDDLYGTRSNRLYLHAEKIEFTHPVSGERIALERKAEF